MHEKLASLESFTIAHKQRYYDHHEGGEGTYQTGDIIDNSKKYVKLLKGTSKDQLTIPGRAADFKDEIQWRMQLRN